VNRYHRLDPVSWHPSSVPEDPSGETSQDAVPADARRRYTKHVEVVAGTAPGEPDPRLLYANERTFLSWIRTSLALMAAGLAVIELLPAFRFAGGRRIVGLPLIALGTVLAATAFRTWRSNELAMRKGEPLPRTYQALILAVGVAVVSAVALLLAAFS
jgi:putative membrane protein